jgi:hypothetical protein
MCGSDVTFGGRTDITVTDQYHHVTLSTSMAEALKGWTFPPRVSPILVDGLGNPFHQFYSPLADFYLAAVCIIVGDVIEGFLICNILFLVLSYVYTFRLTRYLTLSSHCAVFASFLFVTAPYLSTDRVLRGAIPEFYAFCLLPMVLYYNLRTLHLKKFWTWVMAVLSTSAILQTHLVTGSFFLFFYAVFLILFCLYVLFQYRSADKNKSKYSQVSLCIPKFSTMARKIFAATSVAMAAVFLSMWYLGPVAFYSDLMMKGVTLQKLHLSKSSNMTPVLSVFSVTDTSWNFKMNEDQIARLQAGILLVVSFIAFLYFNLRKLTVYGIPFSLTSCLIFLFIIYPIFFDYTPLKFIDIAQFSYRFLSLFTMSATVAGAVALKCYFRNNSGITGASKTVIVMILVSFSLAFGSRYVYPRLVKEQWVRYMVNSQMILSRSKLIYSEDDYLRIPPVDGSRNDLWTDPERKSVGWTGKPGDWRFRVKLEDYYRESGGHDGEVLLDVLYYPELQTINVLVDGTEFFPDFETYWQKRDTFGPFREWAPEPGSFHGLKLFNLPGSGVLEARVRFTGYRWANWMSFISVLFFTVTIIVRTLQNIITRR